MKAFRLALSAFVVACPLVAPAQTPTRAVVLEEYRSLSPPDASWQFYGRLGVAIDGDYALVSAERFVEDPMAEGGQRHEGAVFMYLRVADGEWHNLGRLGNIETITEWVRPGLAMKNGVAIVILGGRHIYERVGNQWVETPTSGIAPDGIQGEDVEFFGPRILVPRIACSNEAYVLRRIGATWQPEGELVGHSNDCGDSPASPFLDINGERAVVFNEEGVNLEPAVARLYRRNESGTGWRPLATIENQGIDTFFGPEIAMTGPYIALSGSRERGTSVLYETNQSWSWSLYGLQPPDGYLQPHPYSATSIERAGPLFAQRNYAFDRGAYVFNLFRVNAEPNRTNQHLLTLRTNAGSSLGNRLDVTRTGSDIGMRVIVSGTNNAAFIYEVPDGLSQIPVLIHDLDFPSGTTWTPILGTNFRGVHNGESYVWRQPSSFIDAGMHVSTGPLRNQAIQAEITIQSTNGTDRWAGLITRYSGEDNYYYVTLRTSDRIMLRRKLHGEVTTLASAPLDVQVGRKYRLRLESIGNTHRVYLDDRLVFSRQNYDPALAEGYPGIRMYRAATDYDNILVTPSPFTTIYTQNFSTAQPGNWSELGQWQSTGGVFRQVSNTGDARAVIGAATAEHFVQVRVRPLSFNGANRWVGVIARYQDPNNYLYVSLRNNNTLSLRRLVNGQVQVIAERPYAVNTGTWYTLRIEVLNHRTLVYVNNRLEIGTNTDPGPGGADPGKGKVGLAMYRATAEYDDFLAYQP